MYRTVLFWLTKAKETNLKSLKMVLGTIKPKVHKNGRGLVTRLHIYLNHSLVSETYSHQAMRYAVMVLWAGHTCSSDLSSPVCNQSGSISRCLHHKLKYTIYTVLVFQNSHLIGYLECHISGSPCMVCYYLCNVNNQWDGGLNLPECQ